MSGMWVVTATCFTTFRRGVFTHPTWALTIGAITSLLLCHHWLYSIYGFQALTGVTLAKTVAYLSVPLLIHKICKESFQNKEQAWSVTVILGAAWMLFYAPALNSLYYEFSTFCSGSSIYTLCILVLSAKTMVGLLVYK